MRYRSPFIVGIQASEEVIVCKTFDKNLLLLPVIPRGHVVISLADAKANRMAGIAVLVGDN
jgi:hypothetical protein